MCCDPCVRGRDCREFGRVRQTLGVQATSVRNQAFISYSHLDSAWLVRLKVLLKPFLKNGRVEVWDDRYIQVGDDWRREIHGGLARARVGVLLVSPEFAASDFIT